MSDFDATARIFWDNGYQCANSIRDMDARERDLFLQKEKTDKTRGRAILADL